MKQPLKKITLLILAMLFANVVRAGIIGEWTSYPAFSNLTAVAEAGNKVYFLASENLYSLNTNDESVEIYDKTRTLSDCGISRIAWCQAAKRLLILYKNYNIDLLNDDGSTVNISDYYTKMMTGDKTVNAINVYDEFAYLATGFGIIKINMKKAEIADTYNLGIPVDWVIISDNWIYAESKGNGRYGALLTSNLQDKSNWQRVDDYHQHRVSLTDEQKVLAAKYRPNGPERNEHGKLLVAHGRLYSIPDWGSDYSIRPACVQIKEGDDWTVLGPDISYLTERRFDGADAIAVDPADPDHVFVGARSGLFEFRDGRAINEFYFANSPLECVYTLGPEHINYCLITALTFDADGNLWCFNSSAEHSALYVLTPAGKWYSLPHKELEAVGRKNSFERAEEMMIDSRGLMWFVNRDPYTCCLARYDMENDEVKIFSDFTNQDGTKFSFQSGRCVKEDKEGNIWFGTNNGLLYLNADEIMTDDNILNQFKVPRNDGTNLADYLLANANITCMAIDAGNRKWIGTHGLGVYVISSDNLEQVQHFTATNSPLLSDVVESIAIDHATGEAYIGTEVGLCSYTMGATAAAENFNKEDVYAYPNPVTPDYSGPITITGLTYNASVKIVTASGQLVTEGRSNGGSFIWDGCNAAGQPVASGIYMVLAASESAHSSIVTKIAIVR